MPLCHNLWHPTNAGMEFELRHAVGITPPFAAHPLASAIFDAFAALRSNHARLEMILTFHANDLDSLDVQYLVELHYAELRSISPSDACHVLPSSGLRDPAELRGVGALRELAPDHGEVKSMRTAPQALGRGVGRAILRHITPEANSRGYKRLSLETGNTEPFTPALRLYESEGFQAWGRFGDHHDLPFSSFLSRRL